MYFSRGKVQEFYLLIPFKFEACYGSFDVYQKVGYTQLTNFEIFDNFLALKKKNIFIDLSMY
ncbi:hypothetical protein GZ064_04325 [Wolbachia endosymbiont of Diaphorina citri]|nr:hypothetical protein FK497_03385 [Wolbachia endosymbiont of Diaphorina citri]QXY87121.1 hypothetical protein GZ064_04270 [Wolbachia endosymbiont of Diaphorina citri]QXY87126.1 hypothetical protein GZ064_04325 [Wolbachia endosymbiont of Diaphorina citri]QXY88336.1 hypothetical protein GZ065_04325 [Wolbachia endosymbiont of Diaphorina citri]QXY89424.1 hypothetical protein GZ066_03605 [Wolbachia endosymbiont of Diaphorina citri]